MVRSNICRRVTLKFSRRSSLKKREHIQSELCLIKLANGTQHAGEAIGCRMFSWHGSRFSRQGRMVVTSPSTIPSSPRSAAGAHHQRMMAPKVMSFRAAIAQYREEDEGGRPFDGPLCARRIEESRKHSYSGTSSSGRSSSSPSIAALRVL
ncbi:hypothetical protein BHM03_00024792 [Ensete ventricosum]|nr:hypothetical protein BHM03_00024792 [Ensete ventricosum]